MSYTHKVIGLFDSDFDAQDAVDALINNGFNRKDINVSNRRDVNGPSLGNEKENFRDHEHEKHHESGLTAFFKTIFGDKDEDADKHARLAIESGAVITVNTNSEEAAARAADILDDKGALDVNELSSKYGYPPNTKSGYSSDSTRASSGIDSAGPGANAGPNDSVAAINADRVTGEENMEIPRVEERSGPGIGSTPTGGQRSKSRIIEWRGEAAARLREDRDNETKFW